MLVMAEKTDRADTVWPLVVSKDYKAPSVFRPEALLREARRQRGLAAVEVPSVCILDPDGDIVRRLRQAGKSQPFTGWPCYHTQLDAFELAGRTVGIVGCAVEAPFAVLVAEELFASGCRLLLSLTSSGQIPPSRPTPHFVIIDRALRDEGTSYHYATSSEYAVADANLVSRAVAASKQTRQPVIVGATWTTVAVGDQRPGIDRGRAHELAELTRISAHHPHCLGPDGRVRPSGIRRNGRALSEVQSAISLHSNFNRVRPKLGHRKIRLGAASEEQRVCLRRLSARASSMGCACRQI